MLQPVRIILFNCIAMLLFSCKYPEMYRPEETDPGSALGGVEIYLPAARIDERGKVQAALLLILHSGEKVPADGISVSWKSEDPRVASVGETGIISGIAAGRVRIDAFFQGFTASADLEVTRFVDYGKITLSEIFCNPLGSDTGREYIEIYNDNDCGADISGFVLIDGSAGAPFVFPEGSTLGPRQFLVIASSAEGFEGLFGFSPDYEGLSFSLNNSGETVFFKKADGAVCDAVYISGGAAEYPSPPAWGSATLPASPEGHSVFRINFYGTGCSSDWGSGPPTPGKEPNSMQ